MTGKWLLIRQDLYECPDHMGCTGIRDDAGRYSKEEADLHAAKYGPDSVVLESEAPEFCAATRDDFIIYHLQKKVASARKAALEEAAPVISELAGVIEQMLDDMGEHGHSVCGAAKAAARAVLNKVASPELEIDYTMAQAEADFEEFGGKPQMALQPEELVEPWASAIRALIEKEG